VDWKWPPRPKKADESVKDQGDVGCVFDWKGIVYHEFVTRDQMVNKQLYQQVLARLRDAVRRKSPELLCPTILFSGLRPSKLFPVSQI